MTSDDDSPQPAASPFQSLNSHGWRQLVGTRANILVEGQPAVLAQFLDSVRSVLRQPIAMVECGPAMSLVRTPTVVLANVDRLRAEEQRALHAWATDARNADAQLIALSSVALFRMVQAETFDRELYYRLNTILIQLERV